MSADDPSYRKIVKVDILNEFNSKSGDFGWCIECRKTANFYCKDLRLPICSLVCKKKYLKSLEYVNKTYEAYSKFSKVYVHDVTCLINILMIEAESEPIFS